MEYIRIIFLIISILVCSICKSEEDKQGKAKENFKTLFSYDLFFASKLTGSCFDYKNEEAICTAMSTYSHNVKSLKVYKKNFLSFEYQIPNDYITVGDCRTHEQYKIYFLQNELLLEELSVYYSSGYCGIILNFSNGITEKYEMSFNGDLRTLTELTVGDYKFVPVR